jgi:hypothetical protein
MKELVHTESDVQGLYASAPLALPFAPSLHVRAFAIEREVGNVLVYSVPTLAADSPPLQTLGGASRWYLNHRHEALFAPDSLDVPLFVHADDQRSVEKRVHVRGAFSRRHLLDDDFEVIPTPGHTPGATAYLWESGGRRFLFTGDTVYLSDGEWIAAVLDSSDRERYVETLALLRELDFDVLVPWAATAEQPWYALTDSDDSRRRISAILDRVWRGEDH